MEKLKPLFERLNGIEHCIYKKDAKYLSAEDGRIVELHAKEVIELSKENPYEFLLVAYFGDAPTRIMYMGYDALSMKETIRRLRIPRFPPENLGELVFYVFTQKIEDFNEEIPVSLEQLVKSGKEEQLFLILKKLLHVYSGKKIDSDFYRAVKQQP
jgi:hypothetical protein